MWYKSHILTTDMFHSGMNRIVLSWNHLSLWHRPFSGRPFNFSPLLPCCFAVSSSQHTPLLPFPFFNNHTRSLPTSPSPDPLRTRFPHRRALGAVFSPATRSPLLSHRVECGRVNNRYAFLTFSCFFISNSFSPFTFSLSLSLPSSPLPSPFPLFFLFVRVCLRALFTLGLFSLVLFGRENRACLAYDTQLSFLFMDTEKKNPIHLPDVLSPFPFPSLLLPFQCSTETDGYSS